MHRSAHIHVKACIPNNSGNPTLVTQLYFEGDPYMDEFVKNNYFEINQQKWNEICEF